MINAVCNQMLPQSMLTNLARFACILEASAAGNSDMAAAMDTCMEVVSATP